MVFTRGVAVGENVLHDRFFAKYPHRPGPLKKSPVWELYTELLVKHVVFSSAEVAATSIFPCFWINRAVGQHYKDQLHLVFEHRYAYVSSEYDVFVQLAIKMVDKFAAKTSAEVREKMFEVYARGCVLELMFWQSAYKLDQWPACTEASWIKKWRRIGLAELEIHNRNCKILYTFDHSHI